MPANPSLVSIALFVIILFSCVSVEAQPPTSELTAVPEIAKPIPSNATWVPFGGRDIPVRESGTPEYQYLDLPTRIARLSEFLKASSGETATFALKSASLPPGKEAIATNLSELLTAPPPPPATFGQLTSGTNNELQVLTLEQAAKFNIPVIFTNLEGKYTRKILVKNFIAYKDETVNGKQVRIGAGLRWIMDVGTLDVKAELSFPVIAAQAQLGTAVARIRIETPGINNDAINRELNVPTEVNVENYFKMTGAFEKAKALMVSTLAINPQVVELFVDDASFKSEDQIRKEIASSYALYSIFRRKSLLDALAPIPREDQLARAAVLDVYRVRTGLVDVNSDARPTELQGIQAKVVLNGFEVKR